MDAIERSGDDAGQIQTVETMPVADALALVRDYVARTDRRGAEGRSQDPPESLEQLREMRVDAEIDLQQLHDPADLDGAERVASVSETLQSAKGRDRINERASVEFEQIVRRGLIEIDRRRVARLNDEYDRTFFDPLFDPARPSALTFGQLIDQYLKGVHEDAEINNISRKRTDKVETNLALIREIVGSKTLVSDVDYDTCLRARSLLARTPSNRTKLYPKLSLEAAIDRAKAEGKPVLSATTQSQYLETLKNVLELATLKRLLPQNPAASLRPLLRETLSPSEKRAPLTLDQIRTFFTSDFYQRCAPNASEPYRKADRDWRFWLPLLCLFMGMRPNEAAQMLVGDIKRTAKGTWFVDIATSGDEEDEIVTAQIAKTLKTAASRRRIPVHPELIAIGFLDLSKGESASARLFPGLKPDKYGNVATYALKRFRDTFLPEAIKLEKRQSFYSFRHSFRDALRRIDAQPATLQALGGWDQGTLTSDNYGDKSDPDYQAKFIAQVNFPGLDLFAFKSK